MNLIWSSYTKKQKRVACLHIHQALSSPIKKKKKKLFLIIDIESGVIFFMKQASYKHVVVKPTYSHSHAFDKHAP